MPLLQGTFFINGIHLYRTLGPAWSNSNRETLYDLVVDGHDLGDHSLNHMQHNNKDGDSSNAYKNLKADLG